MYIPPPHLIVVGQHTARAVIIPSQITLHWLGLHRIQKYHHEGTPAVSSSHLETSSSLQAS